MVKCVSTIRDLRLVLETWRRRDDTIGFVPTMGALHDGHISLLRHAQSLSTRVVTSIFVNPKQFAPGEDFAAYPRQREADEQKLTENGCDLLFAPDVETMFPTGFSTSVDPGPMGQILEGAVRPQHFGGVATVVTKLLLQVMPDYAFFGEKDYQQFRIVEQVVRDLQIPVSVIPVAIRRDDDDLAMSSRNVYLSPEERERALAIPRTMRTAAEEIRDGHDIMATLLGGQEQLAQRGLQVDYFELVDATTLMPARDLRRPTRLLVAARVGKTRLIDNIAV